MRYLFDVVNVLYHSAPSHLAERSAILRMVCEFLRYDRSKLAFTILHIVTTFNHCKTVAVCLKLLHLILEMRKLRFSEIKYFDQDPVTSKGESWQRNPDLLLFTFLYYLLSGIISNLKQGA